MTEPRPDGLELTHEYGRSLRLRHRDVELARYVYRPWEAQLESPRPYFHPLRTLGGDLVSIYRPHDHIWHKGMALSLPNVGPANFWGGVTYLRGRGYVQLPNNGAMRHRAFDRIDTDPEGVRVAHRLDWITEQGETWFRETRAFTAAVHTDIEAWSLTFDTHFTNISGERIVIGSPTTEGRDNAGYGGLFWRGPRSFTGGRVYGPDSSGGDDLMGIYSPWLAFAGQHDEHGRWATLTFVDAPENFDHPTRWFVRSEPFACVCPAPFFSTELPVEPGDAVSLRYCVVIADEDRGPDGAGQLAKVGLQALKAAED
jgi:hypothetical protein